VGHYSYVTLGAKNLRGGAAPKKLARQLKADKNHIQRTFDCSMQMIQEARAILDRVDDHFLVRLVDVTELRVRNFFRKEFEIEAA
jgi:hypothetical protein